MPKNHYLNNRRTPACGAERPKKAKQYRFSPKQLRCALRRTAGVFELYDGTIATTVCNPQAVIEAIRNQVVRKAYPIEGLESPDVHRALFEQAVDLLVGDGSIVIKGHCAKIDAGFARHQKNLSRDLRAKARKRKRSASPKAHRDNGRRGASKKRYDRNRLPAVA